MAPNEKFTDDMLTSRPDKLGQAPPQKGGGSLKRNVTDLLAVLSKPGALRLLELAESGIKIHASTHQQVGLSKKQYYTRISQLVRIGLIEKVGSVYLQTGFGTIVWRDYIPRLRAIMDL